MTKDVLWLRTALAEAGYRQKDLAKAWRCDDAVVSRFIKTGEPELTWDRAQVLAQMLGMTLEEFKLRIAENLPPRKAVRGLVPKPSSKVDQPGMRGGLKEALDDLHASVERVRRLLPQAHIRVTINYGEE